MPARWRASSSASIMTSETPIRTSGWSSTTKTTPLQIDMIENPQLFELNARGGIRLHTPPNPKGDSSRGRRVGLSVCLLLAGNRDCDARVRGSDLDAGPQMLCERFDDPRAETGRSFAGSGRHTDAVISHRQLPVRLRRSGSRRQSCPRAWSGKGVFQGIDHEFGDNQAQTHRLVRVRQRCRRPSPRWTERSGSEIIEAARLSQS